MLAQKENIVLSVVVPCFNEIKTIGEVIENITTEVGRQNGQLQQECIQRIYGTDKQIGHCWTNHHIPEDK